jgi:ubiquinone/menaquinone biosynthesis C-methylase UbiE
MDTKEVEEREAAFWDAEAEKAGLDLDISAGDPLVRKRLELLGDVAGKKVLDVGCGTGFWSVYLAKSGASIWGIDISPKSIEVTKKRANAHGVADKVHAEVMSATKMNFPDGFFDVVHGQDIIHHLEADLFGREIARVLNAGGYAVFHENCANNPLLMFARNHICGRFGIPKWSSADEYPLTRAKLAQFGRFFQQTKVYFPVFLCFFFIDAKVFHYQNRLVTRVCRTIDGIIYRVPFLRRYSYRQMIRLTNPVQQPHV